VRVRARVRVRVRVRAAAIALLRRDDHAPPGELQAVRDEPLERRAHLVRVGVTLRGPLRVRVRVRVRVRLRVRLRVWVRLRVGAAGARARPRRSQRTPCRPAAPTRPG